MASTALDQIVTRARRHAPLAVCLLLASAALASYWPALSNGFVSYDDPDYVTENYRVRAGLSWEGVVWAFGTTQANNWHPLTWLSHMLDCQLYGLNPRGHHLTSVLLHVANTLLLFLFLNRMTGALARSAFLGALFALHPMHVESVAWVAERKDVLSAFFFILTLCAYARYAECRRKNAECRMTPASSLQPPAFYFLSLFFFALGLMSKPMVVTLPFVLLLLDFWPLGRLKLPPRGSGPVLRGETGRTPLRLGLEKLPFLGLAAVAAAVTIIAQGKAMTSFQVLPFSLRAANVPVAYVLYLVKLVWPAGLSPVYLHPGAWPGWQVAAALLLLVAVSCLASLALRRHPYILVGWLWFLGTLVPVIGLIQVGIQFMADRYSYLPSIGLFVVVVWGAWDLLESWRRRGLVLGLAGVTLALVFAALTRLQIAHWRNGEELFRHALALNPSNTIAHYNLGHLLVERGEPAQARQHFQKLVELTPAEPAPYASLALALCHQGRLEEAIEQGHKALRLQPDHAGAHNNLGLALARQGKLDEARGHFLAALKAKPDFAAARQNLGNVLSQQGDLKGAENEYAAASRLAPNSPEVHYNYALLLAKANKPAEALAHYRAALRLKPDYPDALNNLAWTLATSRRPELRNGAEAVQLAERACQLSHYSVGAFLGTLDAAYAEAGRFAEAIQTARRARELFAASGQDALAEMAGRRLELYQARQPFHEE